MRPTSTLFSETPIGVNVMRSLLLSAAMVALIAPTAMAQSTDGADAPIMEAPGKYLVFFPWNKAALTADDQRVVAQAAEEFRTTGSARINVTGYTDTSGSPEYNLRLSERRAQMVAAELERLGVPAADLVVIGRGQEDLRVPTADNVREAGNRRVEIVFDVPAPAPAPEVAAKDAEPPHPSEAVPRLGLELGRPLRPQFRRAGRERLATARSENDLAGVELSFNALPGDIVSLTLKQAILYSFNGEDDGLNGRTGLGLGLTPLNLGFVQPLSQRQSRLHLRPGRPGRHRGRPGAGLRHRAEPRHRAQRQGRLGPPVPQRGLRPGHPLGRRRPGVPVLGTASTRAPPASAVAVVGRGCSGG